MYLKMEPKLHTLQYFLTRTLFRKENNFYLTNHVYIEFGKLLNFRNSLPAPENKTSSFTPTKVVSIFTIPGVRMGESVILFILFIHIYSARHGVQNNSRSGQYNLAHVPGRPSQFTFIQLIKPNRRFYILNRTTELTDLHSLPNLYLFS